MLGDLSERTTQNRTSDKAKSFEDLRGYKEAFRHQQVIFELSMTFPTEERHSLTSQIRRSSRSGGANIAEAWRKRRCEAHLVSKLTDADAELAETLHHINTALSCEHIDEKMYADLRETSAEVGAKLGRMLNQPHKYILKPKNTE